MQLIVLSGVDNLLEEQQGFQSNRPVYALLGSDVRLQYSPFLNLLKV